MISAILESSLMTADLSKTVFRASKPCLVNQCLAVSTLRRSQGHPWRDMDLLGDLLGTNQGDERNTTSKTTGKSPCWSLSHEKKTRLVVPSHEILLVYSLQLSPINGFSPRSQVVQLPNQSTRPTSRLGWPRKRSPAAWRRWSCAGSQRRWIVPINIP